MFEYLEFEKTDGIAKLVFNRPESRNAISSAMRKEIVEALHEAQDDKTIGVLLIAANGKSFCAGRDMKEVGKNSQSTMQEIFEDYEKGKDFLGEFQKFSKPIIAAVNGHALGYGTSIVSYCDLVVAGNTATFGFPEIRNNIVPSTAAFKTSEIVSKRIITEMVLLGNRYTSTQAKEIGLINVVTEDEKVMDYAMDWAKQLANNDVMTNELCKSFLKSLDLPGYERKAEESVAILSMGYINLHKR